jgi:DNA-binding MarR family transcriptional regulator
MTKKVGSERFPPMTISAPHLLKDGDDTDFRNLVDSLVRFACEIQKLRQVLSEAMGVTQPQYNMIMLIAHNDNKEGIGVGEMALKMGVTPSFVVVETNKLYGRGLINKSPSTIDRRRINLNLTDKSAALVAEIGPLQRTVNNLLCGSLGSSEFRSLGSTMGKLIACCASARQSAGMSLPRLQKIERKAN